MTDGGRKRSAVVLIAHGTVESAVEAMKRGAYDFLTKPFPLGELEVLVQKAYERHQLQKENSQLNAALKRSEPTFEIIGKSAAMAEVRSEEPSSTTTTIW